MDHRPLLTKKWTMVQTKITIFYNIHGNNYIQIFLYFWVTEHGVWKKKRFSEKLKIATKKYIQNVCHGKYSKSPPHYKQCASHQKCEHPMQKNIEDCGMWYQCRIYDICRFEWSVMCNHNVHIKWIMFCMNNTRTQTQHYKLMCSNIYNYFIFNVFIYSRIIKNIILKMGVKKTPEHDKLHIIIIYWKDTEHGYSIEIQQYSYNIYWI